MKRKLLTIILALAIALTAASCAKKDNPTDTPDTGNGVSDKADKEDYATQNDAPETTGKDDKGDGTDNTGDTSPDNKGDSQTASRIACGPVSAVTAAKLYNENDGGYVIHEITSMNSMYIVENGDTISAISDLEGKTVYTEYENDMGVFALKYLLNNIGILDTVTITEKDEDWIEKKMESGEELICLADLDMAIELLEDITTASARINIAEEWKSLTGFRLYESVIVAERNSIWDSEVLDEMEDWDEDVLELKRDADRLGLSYDERTVSGEYDMMDELTDFYMKMYQLDPDIIGGSVPDDAFYSVG